MESESRLAMKEIGGKREEHGVWEEQRRQTMSERPAERCRVPSIRWCQPDEPQTKDRNSKKGIHAAWK